MEGTLSLGIYDSSQKLVRMLHREAELEEFEIGSDALIAIWDGNNDAGERLPAGRYHARGYAVGEVEVEGIGFFFNDWVTDERSPRVEKILDLATEDGRLLVTVRMVGNRTGTLLCDSEGKVIAQRAEAPSKTPCPPLAARATDCSPGKAGTWWVVDRISPDSPATEVKQFSSGELLRRLSISAADPQPARIAASREEERIFLLEENSSMQRLRALTLLGTQQSGGDAVSDWRVDFEKKILSHRDFVVENGKPVLSSPGRSAPVDKVAVTLQPNPLQGDKQTSAELSVGFNGGGSFLQTADGLPLQTISETPQLTRVVLARHGEKSLDVFQDDGAVVEHFQLSALDQLMAFDCGEFELK